jgi:hypothetical protein
MLHPFGSFPNTKSRLAALSSEAVIGHESGSDALVHHGQTVVSKSPVIRRCRYSKKLLYQTEKPAEIIGGSSFSGQRDSLKNVGIL